MNFENYLISTQKAKLQKLETVEEKRKHAGNIVLFNLKRLGNL
jgi:hypothetical protein